ncbi:erythromycin esterase family protein [Nocardia lijiangensis]|uniref:erythromycin esterase family protein n=1 Tax=Nocardia lijiangensis TaxID=299618 RepID=UPI000A7DF119|nr:erythromycin esterase family protein [Nocardia lijiangensis]
MTTASSIAQPSAELTASLRAAARPVASTEPGFVGQDLDELAETIGPATIVGLGESTRFSRQTYGVRERLFRILVGRYGFRALAIQDSARSGERLDEYVSTGAGDPESALAGAWRPLRTAEMVETLTWIRLFNEQHPDDPIRVFGVEPPHAEPSDYDAVLDYLRQAAPDRLTRAESHLDPIRTAHQIDEHVQRHQGIHPGRPFAEHARDALALLDGLPDTAEHRRARAHAQLIVDFHEQSVAGQGGFARDERPSAERVLAWQRETGAKIAYWDGIAHVSAQALGVGSAAGEFRGTGAHLRDHFGTDYVAVAIGFHHGDLGVAQAPRPRPELVDALLGGVDLAAFYVDLRTEATESVDSWRRAPAELRTISGIYDPAKDAEAHIGVPSLAGAFDVLVHIRETSPVRWLPAVSG